MCSINLQTFAKISVAQANRIKEYISMVAER